jgi:hypothetical protein
VKQESDGGGDSLNGLEGFSLSLKRKLAPKGGMTRSQLPFYLAECVWKYDPRSDSDRIKRRRIVSLFEKIGRGWSGTLPLIFMIPV